MPEPTGTGLTPGEAGGMFAGILALLALVGRGIAWIVGWSDARAISRSAKLDQWHKELVERDRELDARDDRRLAALEGQVAELTRAVDKWRTAFHLVSAELLQKNPKSVALMQAQKILAEAFPLHLDDMAVPADMGAQLDRLD